MYFFMYITKPFVKFSYFVSVKLFFLRLCCCCFLIMNVNVCVLCVGVTKAVLFNWKKYNKKDLDLSLFPNHPLTNLCIAVQCKVVVKSMKLISYSFEHNSLKKFRLASRAFQSRKTAPLKVMNHLHLVTKVGNSVVALFDLGAAFDTDNHSLLLSLLATQPLL